MAERKTPSGPPFTGNEDETGVVVKGEEQIHQYYSRTAGEAEVDVLKAPITFDENGDPTEAYIGIYQYGADNKYTLLNTEFGSLNE